MRRGVLESPLYPRKMVYRGDDWFAFERDIEVLLTRLNYQILHKAPLKGGDGGIDVRAQKTTGEIEEDWLIQCKCWRGDRPVGVSVIRELLGAMTDVSSEAEGRRSTH